MTTLKNVLLLNAVTSGATGIALALMPNFFAGLFEIEQLGPFIEVGVFLIVYAVAVGWVSRLRRLHLKAVHAVIIADILWVATSTLLIVLQPFNLSVLGNVMIAAVALWVLLMAYLQYRAVKPLKTT